MTHRIPTHRSVALAGVTLVLAALFTFGAMTPGLPGERVASAQDDPSPTTSVVPETTSTLPLGNEDVGNILPRPNSGREPESPGDPGGSQQVALFFLVCFVIVAMTGFVWGRSRVTRARRAAAGKDPVKVVSEHGGDVRAPRPPGIVD
ncbi:MAG: hypothetical protein H6517_05560 [Microthrixaceae bacterium]|nr:hypothetical protein [Microthrixaceae bacterium]